MATMINKQSYHRQNFIVLLLPDSWTSLISQTTTDWLVPPVRQEIQSHSFVQNKHT